MALSLAYTNVEPSFRNRGEYVGYGQGVWRIFRIDRNWRARHLASVRTVDAPTLLEINAYLRDIDNNAGMPSANVKLAY